MDPLSLIGAGVAGAGSIFNIVSGAIQAGKGRKILNSAVLPTYTRPTETSQAMAIAKNNYFGTGMPGAQELQDRLGSSAANAYDNSLQVAGSGGDALDAISKINYNQDQQLNQIQQQQAAYKLQQEQEYLQQLGIGAGYTDKEFDLNKLTPYRNKIAQGQALIGAGNTNVGGGVNQLTSLGAGLATNYMNDKLIIGRQKGSGSGSNTVINPYG